jgi:two-component system chemotaxis response regulator CheB
MNAIRVLVVDDSATMRGLITATLSSHADIEVIGAVGDAFAARQTIKALNPDVVTLDVEMPEMNGLEFLDKIMRLRPMPVVMVSTLTQAGTEVTLKALEIGAVDCVAKPTGGEGFRGLVEAVRAAAQCRVRPIMERPAAPTASSAPSYRSNGRIVGIGSSTGGVEALFTVLSAYPKDCPPTVITQHMPAGFTKSFAERLNRSYACEVMEAFDGAPIQAGRVYIAPGGDQHLMVGGGAHHPICRLEPSEPVNRHRPSVDVLFDSLAKVVGAPSVGVILTGMGRDGAEGLLKMRKAGARTLGQDESSCVVYGMPKAAFEIGAVEKQAPLDRIGRHILEFCAHELREAH